MKFLYFPQFIYSQLFATGFLQKKDMEIFGSIITVVGLPRYVCPNLNNFHTKRDYRTQFLQVLREIMGVKIVHMCNIIGETEKNPIFHLTL